MAAPSIATVPFPATMKTNGGGRIIPHWQEDRVSANGTVYRAGEQWLEWTWEALSTSDYNWLLTQYAALPAAFVLFTDDDRGTNATFTSGAMLKPINGGTYKNGYVKVSVQFRSLMPILP